MRGKLDIVDVIVDDDPGDVCATEHEPCVDHPRGRYARFRERWRIVIPNEVKS